MNINNHTLHLQSLFDIDGILFKDSQISYKDFLAEAIKRSKELLTISDGHISLCVENTEDSLIQIVAAWFSKKIVILHAPGTPEETLEHYHSMITLDISSYDEPVACYILTSGSTTRPKPIPLTFNNLFIAAKNYNNHFAISSESYMPVTLPIYHVGGLLIFLRTITSGATTSMKSPGNLSSAIFETPPTHLSVVPIQIERILESPKDLNFYKETIFILGGAKTSLNTLKKMASHGLRAASTYGMTETCAMVMATRVTSDVEILKSIGSPFDNVTISFSKEDTLIITSPTVSPIFKNSTIETKDKASLIDGRFFIKGRVDNVFISGGENINPLEIEDILSQAGVEDPFVIGVDDDAFGKKSILFYRGNKTPNDVKEIAKVRLSPFKRPRHYFKIPEYAFTGIKIKKSILKELAPLYVKIEPAKEIFPLQMIGDPRKPWIIFIHGFMGKKEDWSHVSKHLQQDFFCLAIDTPGHGENTNFHYSSLVDYQDEFKKFARLLDHKFHLVGYSQGGRIALGLVLSGIKVESLILESSALGIVDEQERESRYKLDLTMFKNISSRVDLKNFLIYWYENPLFGQLKNHATFSELLSNMSEGNWKLWQESVKVFSVGIQPDYRVPLSRVKNLKALTICGEHDHKYLAASMEMKTKFNFELSKVMGVSHNTHVENPTLFVETLSKFLKS